MKRLSTTGTFGNQSAIKSLVQNVNTENRFVQCNLNLFIAEQSFLEWKSKVLNFDFSWSLFKVENNCIGNCQNLKRRCRTFMTVIHLWIKLMKLLHECLYREIESSYTFICSNIDSFYVLHNIESYNWS